MRPLAMSELKACMRESFSTADPRPVLLAVAAVATALLVWSQLLVADAAAGGGSAQPLIGLPGCPTSCGGVSVPYPFGIEAGCHLRGFNLTCNTSYTPPRLFSGRGRRVGRIFHSTMHLIIHSISIPTPTSDAPLATSGSRTRTGLHYLYGGQIRVGWEIGSSMVEEWSSRESRAGDQTCPWDLGATACHSSYSTCQATTRSYHLQRINNITGYVCRCDQGYHGNPYLRDGCQDVDECALPDKCYGDCTNLPGNYSCHCPKGTMGDPYTRNGCTKPHNLNKGLITGLGIGSGGTLLFVVLGNTFIIRKIKTQRKKRMRQRFFKQNRGQLLQQLVCQKTDIAERMIVSLDELEKATNNFDKARELGGGGHGIVYKGILSSLHVVAIKKSKIVIQKEIDEFINEVAILSQVNHRNIVKLFGCCLETEVPLLIYEFISNGTLYGLLHVENLISLSWRDRLRIAVETSRALAYLHSLASMPIIHRDVKSPNILLDDNLTVKLSDFGASRYAPLDQTGLNTTVQGTFGYLDPMYHSTGHLTEKSDVYSFGVLMIELLTRKKPVSYRSLEGHGLVYHFVTLLSEGNLVHILDPQVLKEGNGEVVDIALLAAICVKHVSKERPTMRQVEMTLESIYAAKECVSSDITDDEWSEEMTN